MHGHLKTFNSLFYRLYQHEGDTMQLSYKQKYVRWPIGIQPTMVVSSPDVALTCWLNEHLYTCRYQLKAYIKSEKKPSVKSRQHAVSKVHSQRCVQSLFTISRRTTIHVQARLSKQFCSALIANACFGGHLNKSHISHSGGQCWLFVCKQFLHFCFIAIKHSYTLS